MWWYSRKVNFPTHIKEKVETMYRKLLMKAAGAFVSIMVVAYVCMGVAYRESVEPIIWLTALMVVMAATYICGMLIVVDKAVNIYRRKAKKLDRELNVALEGANELRDELAQSIPALLAVFAEIVQKPNGLKGDEARIYFSGWLIRQMHDPDNRLLAALKALRTMYVLSGDDYDWLVEEFLSDMPEERREAYIERLRGICIQEVFERPEGEPPTSESTSVSD